MSTSSSFQRGIILKWHSRQKEKLFWRKIPPKTCGDTFYYAALRLSSSLQAWPRLEAIPTELTRVEERLSSPPMHDVDDQVHEEHEEEGQAGGGQHEGERPAARMNGGECPKLLQCKGGRGIESERGSEGGQQMQMQKKFGMLLLTTSFCWWESILRSAWPRTRAKPTRRSSRPIWRT